MLEDLIKGEPEWPDKINRNNASLNSNLTQVKLDIDSLSEKIENFNTPSSIQLINRFLQVWQRGTTITNPVNTYIADRLKIDGNGTFRAKLGADNKPIGGAILTGNIDCRYLMEHIDFEWLDGRELTFSYSVDGHVTSNTFIANVGNCPFDGEGRRIAAFSPGAGELDWFNLDIGDRAMPFTPRPIAEELDLCQRYFEKSYDVNVAPGTSGADGGRVVTVVPSNNVISFQEFNSTSFKVSKRVPPTIVVYSILGVPNSVSGYGHSAMPANSGLSSARGTGGFVAFTSVALTTSNTMLTYHYTADAEL